MNEINNEIIEMPKRVSQAFGRTTYTFYFQKDLMNAAYANKNVNNFGYNVNNGNNNLAQQEFIDAVNALHSKIDNLNI